MTVAYVVTWRWSDSSEFGVLAVFSTREQAEKLVELISLTDPMKRLDIHTAPIDTISFKE